jgi:KaiC/GvpD/RAD55 family RecA-like ATPase
MALMSLGNHQIDQLLGGGIEEQKCTIFVGDPGSGKTALSLQFLTDPSASKIPSAYICIDKKPERIMEKTFQMNQNVEDQISDGKLKFVEVSIQEWEPSQAINELLLTIQIQIDALIQNFQARRLIIDSLLPHVLCGFSTEIKQYFIRELLQIIHSYQRTSICILYEPEMHESIWLNTGIVSDQIIFNKKSELAYTTYWMQISKNCRKNINGNYRFTHNESKGISVKHRL